MPFGVGVVSTLAGLNSSVQSVFSLRVGPVQLVVPSVGVLGVVAMEPPTRIPRSPTHILGLVPHGEGAIAVVDLAEFLQVREPEAAPAEMSTQRVVIAKHNELEAGLLCDQTHGVMRLPRDKLEAPTVLKGGRLGEFVEWEFDGPGARAGVLNLAGVLEAASIKRRER